MASSDPRLSLSTPFPGRNSIGQSLSTPAPSPGPTATRVSIATGEKLWLVARPEIDLRSRRAYDDFNGASDMTPKFKWEMLHMDSRTTLCVAVFHINLR